MRRRVDQHSLSAAPRLIRGSGEGGEAGWSKGAEARSRWRASGGRRPPKWRATRGASAAPVACMAAFCAGHARTRRAVGSLAWTTHVWAGSPGLVRAAVCADADVCAHAADAGHAVWFRAAGRRKRARPLASRSPRSVGPTGLAGLASASTSAGAVGGRLVTQGHILARPRAPPLPPPARATHPARMQRPYAAPPAPPAGLC